MRRVRPGAMIRTAEGWREIPRARPQVVFRHEPEVLGPIDWETFIDTGGWLFTADGVGFDLDRDGDDE